MKTTEIKKVLIGLDYDPTAEKVAEEGHSIAKAMGAEVTLLHVISDPINYTSPGHVTIMGFAGYMGTDALQTDTVDALKKASLSFLELSKKHLGDKTIQTLVEEGDCADTILKIAKSTHTDIIVLGSHSHKWLENIVMGSVTEKVLHHTSIPLFIIPTKQKK
jgi:nucleotide-binding universal stress UspA family protein